MGKTEKGAVWLNAENLSPYDYWQFWRNVEDADVLKLMRIYTDLSVQEIDSYHNLSGADLNHLKVRLADEATYLAHGSEVLEGIHETVQKLFQADKFDIEICGIDQKGNSILKSSLPVTQVSLTDLQQGLSVLHLLVQTGLAKSNGEARRLIRGNGCALNGEKITQEDLIINSSHLQDHNTLRLSMGKKSHVLVQGVNE
jgi:tyrosyl-tRNA synthetase